MARYLTVVRRLRKRMSAVLFVACDVSYGEESKHGKKSGLRLVHGIKFAAFQGQRLCEVK